MGSADLRILVQLLSGHGPIPGETRDRLIRQIRLAEASALDAKLNMDEYEQVCDLERRYPECAAIYLRDCLLSKEA